MMKPKVLPGLVGAHTRLALVLRMVFFLPPVCGSLGRDVGGSGRGWCGFVSHPVALFWATATQGRHPPPSPGGGWKVTWPPVPVRQGHPAPAAHSGGWHRTGTLLH